MAGHSSDYVFDSLLCYLSNPLFQVPVISFMESNCLIFDTSMEDSPEYRSVHEQYRQLVSDLLKAFQEDSGLTRKEIIQAMKTFNADPELQSLFQGLFEQVLAMDEFAIFVHLMINKNIELQKQALMLISVMRLGREPEGFINTQNAPMIGSTQDEEEVLKAVLELSRQEFETQKQIKTQEEEDYQTVIVISGTEALRLQQESKTGQEKLRMAVKNVSLAENSSSIAQKHDSISPTQQPLPSLTSDTTTRKDADDRRSTNAPPSSSVTKNKPAASAHNLQTLPTGVNKQDSSVPQRGQKEVTGKKAAAEWMKTAEEEEVQSSDAHSKALHAAAAGMAGLTEEEQKRRVKFLKEQRDKLMEMKRREREKQLLSATSTQPLRPASARAAQVAIKLEMQEDHPQISAEDGKKLAMRKTIADRIKSELMAKK